MYEKLIKALQTMRNRAKEYHFYGEALNSNFTIAACIYEECAKLLEDAIEEGGG